MSSPVPASRPAPRSLAGLARRSLSRAFVRTLLRALLRALGDALSPPTCAACDARLPRRAVFCAPCAAEVTHAAATFPEGVAFGLFDGALARALRRFKYEGRPDLAAPLGNLAARAALRARVTGDLVVPVPLHPCRLAERGYNQAALLAAEVATALALPLAARALDRVRHTPQQARLSRAERAGNVAAAFTAPSPRRIQGRRVILVDDVATTGSTLGACREALMRAGATSVVAVVVAQAE